MAEEQSPWKEMETVTPGDIRRLQTETFAIEAAETECFKATFNTPSGQKCLDLLHKRYIDAPRLDPYAQNPLYHGWTVEGAAGVVRMLEAYSRQ